jgi:ribosomal protein S18 acetylase RimI-like enzyme
MIANMSVRLRGLQAADVGPIEAILRANGPVFSEVEVRTAVEMLASGLEPGSEKDPDGYRFLVAELDGKVAGYAVYARTALTLGTFDLYWIAVDPGVKGTGPGPALIKGVEEGARKDGGRLVVLETSSRPDYARARRFYEKQGYERAATIPDFYREGDDKIIYAKRVDRPEKPPERKKSGRSPPAK